MFVQTQKTDTNRARYSFLPYPCCKARAAVDSPAPHRYHGPLELSVLDRRRRRRCFRAPNAIPSRCPLRPNCRRIRSFGRQTDESSEILEERQNRFAIQRHRGSSTDNISSPILSHFPRSPAAFQCGSVYSIKSRSQI